MRTEDSDIIQECLNGETEAFGMLVDKYKEGIYAFAYGKLRDFQDAQDVTQEVFIEAYRSLRSLRRWESFSFWLYRIAYTKCGLLMRNRSKKVDRDFIEDHEPEIINKPSLNLYQQSQLTESVRESLDSLPEAYREVLVLYYFGGMNSNEIAEATGRSPNAIRMSLSRARAQFRKEMIGMMDTAFEGQRLRVGFTFRVVEAVKRIKIDPTPSTKSLPWGLSLATGLIVAFLSFGSNLSLINPSDIFGGSPLPSEAKVLRIGEIPVSVLKTAEISALSNNQGKGNSGDFMPSIQQNSFFMAPQAGEGKWTEKTDMPTARCGICSALVNGKIYAIGGAKDLANPLSIIEEYDPITNTWNRKSKMANGRAFCSASVVNGKIYVIGGMSAGGNIVSTLEEYDPITDIWQKKANMPTARIMLATSEANGKIYAIGGAKTNSPASILSLVEEYDPITDSWERKSNMPTARHALSSVMTNGKIYAIGGWVGNTWGSMLEEYNPKTDIWEKKADMPTVRNLFSSCEVNGKIYAIGGQNNSGILSNVEAYDSETDTWMTKADMPTARLSLSVSAIDSKIYAIGGTTQALLPNVFVVPVLGTVEEYDTGFVSELVQTKGKLPTTWGDKKR